MTTRPAIDGHLLSAHPHVRADIARILAADLPWHMFDGATVLVTGANGFLPAYMVETLLTLASRHGGPRCRVIAMVRSRARAEHRFAAWLDNTALDIVEQDLSRPLTWPGRADIIIHAASQASPKHYGSDPVGTALPNVLGTASLLERAAKCAATRVLYVSSSEVYGPLAPGETASERNFAGIDPATVRACYAESKRMGETLCVAYASQYGVPAVVVRPFHTYGPGLSLDDGRVFSDFIRDVVDGRDIVLNSTGLAERAFCYLGDATLGFFTALLRGAPGEAYNIADPSTNIAIRDLAALVAGLYPERNIAARINGSIPSGYIPSAVQRILPDISRINALGWSPQTSLADGFRRAIDVYLDAQRSLSKTLVPT